MRRGSPPMATTWWPRAASPAATWQTYRSTPAKASVRATWTTERLVGPGGSVDPDAAAARPVETHPGRSPAAPFPGHHEHARDGSRHRPPPVDPPSRGAVVLAQVPLD